MDAPCPPADRVDELRDRLLEIADPTQAPAMTAYMKDRFAFLGVKAPQRRAAARDFLVMAKTLDGDDLVEIAVECWRQPEREFHYVGMDMLRKWAGHLEPQHLPDLEELLRTNAWWDTVDSLAVWTVGPLVANYPELVEVMDQWVDDDDIWIARTAILHQLSFKADTDADRLFRYILRRADEPEFFLRKASGWALRQYAREDPDAVRAFVQNHTEELSGLTKREALRHLN